MLLLSVFTVLNILDVITTYIGLNKGMVETNPFSLLMQQHLPYMVYGIIKIVLVMAVVYMIKRYTEKKNVTWSYTIAMFINIAVYSSVVYSNYMLIR